MAVKKTQSSKKASAKKAAAKKGPAKKVPAKKAIGKKAPAKKAPAKKPAVTKPVAPKPVAKKSAPKGSVPKAKVKAEPKAKASPKKLAKPAEKAKSGEGASPRAVSGSVFGQAKDVRILVVDDEPEVLELLVPFLRGKGYTVSEAQDGDQALEKILTERPNIVVLDVMMPGLSGWEISRYVRERAELDPVRIIMATGIGKETNAATSPLYGADAYLDKPFRLDALDRTVIEVIKRIESTAF